MHYLTLLLSVSAVAASDVCAPVTWTQGSITRAEPKDGQPHRAPIAKRFALVALNDIQPGQVNCRYSSFTTSSVNYYTCTQLANRYSISVETFFMLNPTVALDCGNIQPKTEYCVAGFVEPVRATSGLCGPKNGNATCIGTAAQCCNAKTWMCGNTEADCAPGTCYEGACAGDTVYGTDGTCGPAHGNRICAGVWGNCCNNDGRCGSGDAFCADDVCSSGNCTRPVVIPIDPPWMSGNSTDGFCGAAISESCSVLFGNCCNKDNVCGALPSDCGVGCQPEWGTCDPITTKTSSSTTTKTSQTSSSTSTKAAATPISLDGHCGSASSTSATCAGSTFGQCCSVKGNCGDSAAFCAVSNSCQPSFGKCVNISVDGKCGAASSTNATCSGSSFGQCCSVKGNCGDSAAFCAAANSCQPSFGTCTAVSADGKCGPVSSTNVTCSGSTFGQCCSVKGNCGSSAAFCATSNLCQSSFGTCYPVSTDGKCGAASTSSASCSGSTFGTCCSVKGNCGSTSAFCGLSVGCQTAFGTCTS